VTTRTYNSDFTRYAAQSSAYSATAITSILYRQIELTSVLDIGCARGTWLRAWSKLGIIDLHGVDGDYVDRQMLEIPVSNFTTANLNVAFDLGRQFDLVQSLEVGEHIEESSSEIFVDCLARHARRYILFSAAPPGQGGEYHVNEQPYEFWREKFETRGFATVDSVRPAIVKNNRISYWYRYNTLLFIRHELLPKIDANLRDKVLPTREQVMDFSSRSFRIRKAVVRRLPKAVQYKLARLKAKVLPTGRI
jgi:SAM-dependent methyltransferase